MQGILPPQWLLDIVNIVLNPSYGSSFGATWTPEGGLQAIGDPLWDPTHDDNGTTRTVYAGGVVIDIIELLGKMIITNQVNVFGGFLFSQELSIPNEIDPNNPDFSSSNPGLGADDFSDLFEKAKSFSLSPNRI